MAPKLSERRGNTKFGVTIAEAILAATTIATITAAVVRFEFGIEKVNASIEITNKMHLRDVEEIKREYREDAQENKENTKEIRKLLRQILINQRSAGS